jgi:hypothetical protein
MKLNFRNRYETIIEIFHYFMKLHIRLLYNYNNL